MNLHLGDCLEVMATLSDESVDAVVTDPPYDLLTTSRNGSRRINNPNTPAGRSARGFMGKAWDGTGIGFRVETWAHCFRLLKPGGHLLAFGGTRTYHRLACAIEDAGFEIRDCLVWGYASGFPKSLDVGKAIDRAAGAERAIVGTSRGVTVQDNQGFGGIARGGVGIVQVGTDLPVTAPATDDAKRWDGWGTALKPAWEPIVMARKPLRGTVAANVLEYGTGALNIDGTRIGYVDEVAPDTEHWKQTSGGWKNTSTAGVVPNNNSKGRWPANVVLTADDEGRGIFDGDVPGVVGGGETSSGLATRRSPTNDSYMGGWPGAENVEATYGDSGTYSRFFLVPKAARSGREPLIRGEVYCRCETVKPDGWVRPDLDQLARTAATSRARAISGATSEDGFGWPMTPNGNATSEPSPQGSRSTTSTGISSTTESRTLSPSTASPTSDSIPAASSSTASGGSDAPSVESIASSLTSGGTSPRKAGRSTGDAGPATSIESSKTNVCEDCGGLKPNGAATGGADGVTRAARRNSHPT